MTKAEAIKQARSEVSALSGNPQYGYAFNTFDYGLNMWRETPFRAGYHGARRKRSKYLLKRTMELMDRDCTRELYELETIGGRWVDFI